LERSGTSARLTLVLTRFPDDGRANFCTLVTFQRKTHFTFHRRNVHRRNVHRQNGIAETAAPNCPIARPPGYAYGCVNPENDEFQNIIDENITPKFLNGRCSNFGHLEPLRSFLIHLC